jgi:two-component system chemotaxis response regulator CheY
MRRILIVEDEPVSRMVMEEELSRYGRCHAVGNGAAALRAYVDALLGRRPFDVVFMDLMMPVMDGASAIERIRDYEARHPQHVSRPVPVVVVTSMEEVPDLFQNLPGGGVSAIIKKTDLPEALGAAITALWAADGETP